MNEGESYFSFEIAGHRFKGLLSRIDNTDVFTISKYDKDGNKLVTVEITGINRGFRALLDELKLFIKETGLS